MIQNNKSTLNQKLMKSRWPSAGSIKQNMDWKAVNDVSGIKNSNKAKIKATSGEERIVGGIFTSKIFLKIYLK